jgi:RNA polymerase sigma factor (sigma-70 family)
MDGSIPAVLRHVRTLAAVGTSAACSDGELLRRFAEAHDEAAFTALVERHGPMVLRVCRHILGHAQDAEDACQATFLVLVRKAASVRKRGSVPSWLFGVATRAARKLRASRARRERGCGSPEEARAVTAEDDPSWREVRAVLDEELLRLPEKYRAPLVLCYLEGRTRGEAARWLGLSLNRLRSRLDYGRQLLHGRLARRGVALPAVLLGGLMVCGAPAAVPALLVVSTGKAAALAAAGRALPAGLVPARVAALTEEVVRTMFLAKLKVLSAALLLLACVGGGLSAALQPVPAATAAEPGQALAEGDRGTKPADGDAFKPDWLDEPLYTASTALVGWWPADGHLFDLAGARHGKRAGTVEFAKGYRGEGLSFPDGNGAVALGKLVVMGRQADLVNTFTLAVWVRPAATRDASRAGQYAGIVGQRYAIFPDHGGEAGKEAGCGLSVGTNGLGVFEHTHDNCPCVLQHDTPIRDWTHVAVVYAKGRPTLYVNGEAVKTGARSTWTVFPGTIFGDPGIGYGPYQGMIDEPMLFGRALSGDEIKAVVRASRGGKPAAKAGDLSEAAFAALWSYLSGERAPRSLFAIDRLAAGGDEAVRRLRPRLLPAPASGKPTVEALVRQLDDDAFEARERATRSLIAKGAGIAPQLRALGKASPSAEVRTRVEQILSHFNDGPVTATPEELRALRAAVALSRMATPAGRKLLAELAEGLPATSAAKPANK